MILNSKVPEAEVVALFIALVGIDYELIAPGLNSLQYLVWRDRNAFFLLFEAALTTEEARKSITKILTVQWGHNEPGAYELLEQLWALDPDLRATSLRQLSEGYTHWPDKQVFFGAFAAFLQPPITEKLRRAYDSAIRNLPIDCFDQISPLLTSYLLACASDFDRDFALVEYLAKNVKTHPAQCVAVLTVLFSQIPISRHYWPAKHALEVLIEAYTRLPHKIPGHPDSEAALDLFDTLISRQDCRSELEEALTQLQAPR